MMSSVRPNDVRGGNCWMSLMDDCHRVASNWQAGLRLFKEADSDWTRLFTILSSNLFPVLSFNNSFISVEKSRSANNLQPLKIPTWSCGTLKSDETLDGLLLSYYWTGLNLKVGTSKAVSWLVCFLNIFLLVTNVSHQFWAHSAWE